MTWTADTVRALLETFDGAYQGEGVVVAVAAVDADATMTGCSDGCPADGRFEIGSVTKTITATLLASVVAEGRAALDDGIGRWLDAGPNADITLLQLATHSSGLPRLAPNFRKGGDRTNPYARYGPEQAEKGLRKSAREPEAGSSYSNFGYQLLGLALERITGEPYAALLGERILTPLAMADSGIGPAGGGTRLPGHVAGKQVGHWDHLLAGPGAVEASIGDFARYIEACLTPPDTDLGAAIRLAQKPRMPMGEHEIGLAWITREGRFLWHNGATGGFAASLAIDPVERRALGALVNSGGTPDTGLDTAVLLALHGGDPRTARPERHERPEHEKPRLDDPAWEERARKLIAALLDGRFGAVHEMLSPQVNHRITVEGLEQGWRSVTVDAGEPLGEPSVASRLLRDKVAVMINVPCAGRTLKVAAVFDASGGIVGLKPLAPGETPPWGE